MASGKLAECEHYNTQMIVMNATLQTQRDELLAALKEAAHWFGRPGRSEWNTDDAWRQACQVSARMFAAIARAEGKP